MHLLTLLWFLPGSETAANQATCGGKLPQSAEHVLTLAQIGVGIVQSTVERRW